MSGRRPDKNEIPELFLEQHALGELAQEQAKTVDSSQLKSAQAALESDSADILARLPAERVVPRIRSQYAMEKARTEALKRERVRSRRVYSAALATAAAVVPLIVVLLLRPEVGPEVEDRGATLPPVSDGVRIKQASTRPFLTVYRKTQDRVEKLEDGDTAGQGDLIQLAYVARGQTHGAVLSIDGAGTVTLHWPQSADASTLLNLEGETPLEQAYELDDAPLFERFFFITSKRPIDVAEVQQLARALAQDINSAAFAPLKLPKEWTQSSIMLKKVVP